MHTLNPRFARRSGLVLRFFSLSSSLALMLVASSAFLAFPAFAAAPKIGEPAPAFEFQGEDGALYSSTELYGEEAVVVAWFPKAFTSG